MLERSQVQVIPGQRFFSDSRDRDYIKFSDIKQFLWRFAPFIFSCAAIGGALGLFYIVTGDPIYTARTQILIEPKIPQLLNQQSEINLSLDTSQVETQIAVLRSEKIANMVIDELDLMNNSRFTPLSGAPLSVRFERLWYLLGLSSTPTRSTEAMEAARRAARERRLRAGSEQGERPVIKDGEIDPEFEKRREVVWNFEDGLSVSRAGVSYAIDIWFQARDPELAARIANATAGAFVREQLETRTEAASEGLRWLESRIQEVRGQMNHATKMAQEFRARHDFSIRDPQSQEGPTLEELEVTAETYRKMYESLLAAFTSSVNQQPYLIADARVISEATRPLVQSHPRKTLTMAFGVTAGLLIGLGLAIARQLTDRSLRTHRQVQDELGLDAIAELPVVRLRGHGFGRFLEVQRKPHSTFTRSLREAMRAIMVADPTGSVRVIGVVSALPTDGKSTVACNLAAISAGAGKRTLLIDADSDKPVLSRYFGKDVRRQETGGFSFLPSSSIQVHELIMGGSHALTSCKDYQCIIVNLPPLTSDVPFVEAAGLVDAVVIVAEWARTPVEMLTELVDELRSAKVSMPGVIMTKVRSLSSLRYRKRLFWWAR